MLQWFRVTAPRTAAVAFFALAVAGISSGAHRAECHDDCAPLIVEHDASAHSVGAGGRSADPPPIHCIVCHWARTFRPRGEVRLLAAPAAAARIACPTDRDAIASSAIAAQPPLRSPPSSSLPA